MARLAAYYQEDFQYAPVGYGPKQRKAAYIIANEQKNNALNSNHANGGQRLRTLAASEPSLSPTYTYAAKTAVMTLKAKPRPLNNKLIEQSRLAVERLEKMHESSPYAVSRLDVDPFDCESVYSQSGRNMYDETYVKRKSKSKDKICKRLSFESCDSYPNSAELCVIRNPEIYHSPQSLQVQTVDHVRGEAIPYDDTFINNCEECIMPPVSFRSDSSHGRWQQWPWNMVDTRASPALLSPPSPLDSGLSSQSITSSPSLEAEPVPCHSGQIQVYRPETHHMCSCPRVYAEPNRTISSPGRYDSGRSSPGAYLVTTKNKSSCRKKNKKNVNNGVIYVENHFEDDYNRGQIRYGMLGVVGEPVPQSSTLAKIPNGKYHAPEQHIRNNKAPSMYYYIDDGLPIKKTGSHPSKSHKSQSDYTRPSVVITEAPDNSNSPFTNGPSSLEQEVFLKSPEPESSLSTEPPNSPSKSSSVTSSSNDMENEERRKSKKQTEKEIRELEDMYKKCNLSDYDLLERAERRDLPTVHQTRTDQIAPSPLTRSKSDTLYETFSARFCNPYEAPYRAPPLRRSGIPDIISDDMALRKNCKPVTAPAFNPADSTITYMLCSSHFTPTVPCGRDLLFMDNPDVEYDDLSYRKHYFGKKNKILDPQPPFGIPLRPPPPQSVYNDYLHVAPVNGLKPLCHPRGSPDVVRDDMAFRTLRKDEADRERIYYDSTDVYKKRRG